jgi:hypothetical protein
LLLGEADAGDAKGFGHQRRSPKVVKTWPRTES